ncbi:MAG: cation:proton antiporter regulatory subunit [Micromonosporaceae bacterium]
MGIRIEQTTLPGIGLRQDVLTASGRRLGVIRRGTGRELLVSALDDPDACVASIPLTDEEADALAEILSASMIASRLNQLSEGIAGLFTEQIAIGASSPYIGRRLGETRARTRTKASIVAVLRDKQVIASPGPEFVFAANDVVVAVGTREGVDGVAAILAGTR